MSDMELATSLSAISRPALIVLGAFAVVQVGLDMVALVDLYRRPRAHVALGNKWIWVLIILLVNLLGAILYFAIGRTPAAPAEVAGREGRPPDQVEKIVDSLYGTRRPDDKQ